MAGVVIVNAQEDNAPAQALAEKLGALGLETEFSLEADELRSAINQADVILALWSPHSYFRADLIDDARFARDLGRLVHARMQNTPSPTAFERDPSIDLTGWRGEENFQPWRQLLNAISGVLYAPPPEDDDDSQFIMQETEDYETRAREYVATDAGGYDDDYSAAEAPVHVAREAPVRAPPPPPPPTPAPAPVAAQRHPLTPLTSYSPSASSYERPSAYAEPVRSEGLSLFRLLIIGVVTFVVVAGAGIGGYAYFQRSQTSDAQAIWDAVDKTDPYALRAFLDSGQAGRFREPAQATLDTLALQRLRVAREADTIEALRAFLVEFPDSRFSAQVNGRIAELQQSAPSAGADFASIPDDASSYADPSSTLQSPPSQSYPPAPAPSPQQAAVDTPRAAPPADAPVSPSPSAPISTTGPLTLTPPSVTDSPLTIEEEFRRQLSGQPPTRTEEDMRRELQKGK